MIFQLSKQSTLMINNFFRLPQFDAIRLICLPQTYKIKSDVMFAWRF